MRDHIGADLKEDLILKALKKFRIYATADEVDIFDRAIDVYIPALKLYDKLYKYTMKKGKDVPTVGILMALFCLITKVAEQMEEIPEWKEIEVSKKSVLDDILYS